MNRTTLLQERRMQTFHDVLGHWQARRLSALEAAELLGMSERSFRRYRQRYEDEGPDGLFDRRLGKASARRVPADQVAWVLDEYRSRYRGWTLKHFHDRLRERHGFAWSYTWTKTTLQRAGLVSKAPRRGVHRRRRERKPCVGMMVHQDGSRHEWLAGVPPLDLIVTMDDATSEIYSAFLVEEEGTASTFRALKQVFTDKGLPCSLAERPRRRLHATHPPGPVLRTMSADRMSAARRALGEIFSFERFRPGPEAVIEALLSGRDPRTVMPTGSGKSLCFPVPTLVMEGLTVVVSPLIALMQDQFATLGLAGVAADSINSANHRADNVAAGRRAAAGETRLLYMAPAARSCLLRLSQEFYCYFRTG